MATTFTKATKSRAKLRAALFGPSGSGKTFSALRIATGIGGRVAVIDTEHGSASKYADRFQFDTCDLADQTVAGYVAALASAATAGYDVVVIDSMSHGWQELLQEVDMLAQAKYRGNTWSAWSEGTPKQKQLVRAILSFPGHVLATMRSKTEWTIITDNGKTRPVRVGLAPEQRKGIEYEFDLLVELSPEHTANIIKDRTGKFQDALIDKPGEEFGQQLAAWLNDGVTPAEQPAASPAPQPEEPASTFAPKGHAMAALTEMHGQDKAAMLTHVRAILSLPNLLSAANLTDEDWQRLADALVSERDTRDAFDKIGGEEPKTITPQQMKLMHRLLSECDIDTANDESVHARLSEILNTEVASRKDLTIPQAATCIDSLQKQANAIKTQEAAA